MYFFTQQNFAERVSVYRWNKLDEVSVCLCAPLSPP